MALSVSVPHRTFLHSKSFRTNFQHSAIFSPRFMVSSFAMDFKYFSIGLYVLVPFSPLFEMDVVTEFSTVWRNYCIFLKGVKIVEIPNAWNEWRKPIRNFQYWLWRKSSFSRVIKRRSVNCKSIFLYDFRWKEGSRIRYHALSIDIY